MKRLLLALLLLLTLVVVPLAFAGNVHTAFLPSISANRTDGLGMHIEKGSGPNNAPGLAALGVAKVRTFFADDQGVNVYQVYLAGGWSAVDTMVLADIAAMKSVGTPIISFARGGICKVPTLAQLNPYATFLAGFVVRYDITYFETWGEPDASGGIPGMFGCFGSQYADRLIYLIERVRLTLPAGKMLGVSFMMADAADLAMLEAVTPYLDWVGVHHYAKWEGGQVVEPYPGTLTQLYDLVAPLDIPILLTEVNLRDPLTVCSPAFRQAQAEYNLAAMDTDFDAKIILVYAGGSSWQCTGTKGSLTEQMLMPGGGYP